jgi:hypothetical protein
MNTYKYGATLATRTYRGMAMEVVARDGVLELLTLGKRADNPLAPRGLQRFEPSEHPAPVFVLSGVFPEDAAMAAEWLDHHKGSIYERDAGRPVADILR